MRTAALRFASWAPSTGFALLLATVLAVVLANSPLGRGFEGFWETPVGLSFGAAAFSLSLRDWVNEGLLTLFFLIVGLEIKREFTLGTLSDRRAAALPVAAALGGMVVPVALFLLLVPEGPWARGWGVPMATDTAFAVALIVLLGSRVPVELRIFLTAAAVVDDIGAILVIAVFYSSHVSLLWLAAAGGFVALLASLRASGVYRVAPYVLLGVGLWACVHEGGLHATLAGVMLAMFIPTRPPPDYQALTTQADAIVKAEAKKGAEPYRSGPSEAALRALDDIHARLESPADRLLRLAGPQSAFFVLPLFALANAGVVLEGQILSHGSLVLGIVAGLALGKPLGFLAFTMLAVRLGLARKPAAYGWRQLAGAGALAGIGFTIALFVAQEAFADPADFAAAKIAVFAASVLSAAAGLAILWKPAAAREAAPPAEASSGEDGAPSSRTYVGPPEDEPAGA